MSAKIEDGYKDAKERYDARTSYRAAYKFNINTDADIIEWLESQTGSKQGAVKKAIRYYIANNQQMSSVVD